MEAHRCVERNSFTGRNLWDSELVVGWNWDSECPRVIKVARKKGLSATWRKQDRE
jgi:hypothetical protein